MSAMRAVEAERRRILIVDDYDGMRVLVAVMVHRLGLEPVTAESADDALLAVDSGAFAAVLSDYEMPGGTGLTLLRTLRARGDQVPFVLMSALFTQELEFAGRRAGATLVVPKGEVVEGLSGVLDRTLSAPSRRSAGSPSRRSRNRPSPSPALRTR
jgi:DNA-binding NtrC family response regulator